MNDKNKELSVYYNSACPVCDAGINSQKSKTTSCSVAWNDIHTDNSYAHEVDAEVDTIRKYLHVMDSEGQTHIGIDAFIQLWKYSPLEQWKAKLISLPLIKPIARAAYFAFANLLFTWNRAVRNWD